MSQPHITAADAAVVSVVAASWLDLIPAVAALLAVVWYLILIWESDTGRYWTGRSKKPEKKYEDEE